MAVEESDAMNEFCFPSWTHPCKNTFVRHWEQNNNFTLNFMGMANHDENNFVHA